MKKIRKAHGLKVPVSPNAFGQKNSRRGRGIEGRAPDIQREDLK